MWRRVHTLGKIYLILVSLINTNMTEQGKLIIETIKTLKSNLEKLHENNIIKYSTYINLINCCDNLLNCLYITKETVKGRYAKKGSLKAILNQLFQLESIIKCISTEKVDRSYDDYLYELLTKLKNVDDIDLWVIKIGSNYSPFCYPLYEAGELSYILVVPEHPNFLTPDLLGLLAHEVAHVHDKVGEYRKQISRIKTGEVLADVLGYILVEFAFTHSLGNYIEYVVGVNNANQVSDTHPSWVARIWVLKALTNEIWQEQKIINRNEIYFNTLISKTPELNKSEEHFIGECIRQYKNHSRDFVKFKFDESILVRIEDISEVWEYGRVGEIIREAVLKNV